ncbi:hypothetical protein O3G_MSEX011623 [Manduca sexta]|uniref:Uncharacterized protein n=1 Tax=Manduca sexta TaxID=7130 RepID=A0A922CVH5_MANSE|nr:hypothetical protein O3G_MSEX011623 [Manduca sexta]
MTQKQIKCGWKARRPKTAEYERRAVLSSYDDFSRVAVDNSRVRLISQIVNQTDGYPPNEFTSYYYGSQYNHPKYSLTSHAAYTPQRRKCPTISSYPSVVGLRWNSNLETSSVEDSQTDINNHTFTCKCENCRMKYCRSKNPSLNTLKPTFKGNIMTFSDKETMTPKLRDACAACSSPSIPRMSNVSVTASCTRDIQAGGPFVECDPIPILKKQNLYKCERCGYRKEKNIDIIQQPERDIDICDGYQECVKPRSIKSIFKRRREKRCEVEPPRKTLYNEGIDDIVAGRCPLTPTVVVPPMELNSESSRVSIPSRAIPNRLGIPYSHRTQSKYHNTCKRSASRLKCNDDDELKHLVASPKVLQRCYTSKPVKHLKLPNIKLPRKVLTSERDIESYVENVPQGHSPRVKK